MEGKFSALRIRIGASSVALGDELLRCSLFEIRHGNVHLDGDLEASSFIRPERDLAYDLNRDYVQFLLPSDMLHRAGETCRVPGRDQLPRIRELGGFPVWRRKGKIKFQRSIGA